MDSTLKETSAAGHRHCFECKPGHLSPEECVVKALVEMDEVTKNRISRVADRVTREMRSQGWRIIRE